MEAQTAQQDISLDRKGSEVVPLEWTQHPPHDLARGLGLGPQGRIAAAALPGSDGLIVVPANHDCIPIAQPVEAGFRVRAIIDQVSEAEDVFKGVRKGPQRLEVRVHVGNDEDALGHRTSPPLLAMRLQISTAAARTVIGRSGAVKSRQLTGSIFGWRSDNLYSPHRAAAAR